jgi:FkbM family methyltransferase
MKNTLLLNFILGVSLLFSSEFNLENIKRYLPENPIILECGAHVGYDTLVLSSTWPKGCIHAIEADPSVFEKLTNRTKNLENVKRYNIALGDRSGDANFYKAIKIDYLSEEHGANYAQGSLLPKNPDYWVWGVDLEKQPIKVPIKTLDDWAATNKIDRIDFMWLDMQGSDFNMLMASSQILKTVKVIQIEISSSEIYNGSILFNEGKSFLEDNGFKLIATQSDEGKPFDNHHGDALFIKED